MVNERKMRAFLKQRNEMSIGILWQLRKNSNNSLKHCPFKEFKREIVLTIWHPIQKGYL